MRKTKWSTKNFYQSLKCALTGVKEIFTSQRNIKIQVVIAIIVITLGFVFKISPGEWIAIVIVIGSVIAMESTNTAIEFTVDLITEERNEKARIAKDASAAGVLLASFTATVVGIIIFLPKIIQFISMYYNK